MTDMDDLQQYLSEIRRYPLLTAEEEKALAMRCAQGDEDAIRKMVNANLRLVVSITREYANMGVSQMDLIQEGSIGLLSAAKKFDYTMNFRFSTYATKCIRQSVTRYLLNNSKLIRVSAYTASQIQKVAKTQAKLIQETGRTPDEETLAEACGLTVGKLRRLMGVNAEVCSLDAPVGEDESSMGAMLEDVHAPQPYADLVREELNQTVNGLMDALEDRQKQVLQMHFGMLGGVCYSLEEISKQLGISKERVRQIERTAMEKLQRISANMGLEEYLV